MLIFMNKSLSIQSMKNPENKTTELKEAKDISELVARPREGWEESATEMRSNGDDCQLIMNVFDDENFEE